jgi:hypothetical protein
VGVWLGVFGVFGVFLLSAVTVEGVISDEAEVVVFWKAASVDTMPRMDLSVIVEAVCSLMLVGCVLQGLVIVKHVAHCPCLSQKSLPS